MKAFLSLFLLIIFTSFQFPDLSRAENLPDLSSVPTDLIVPPLSDGLPCAGKRVKMTLPEYAGTDVHHVLYLPSDWKKGKHYPLIVEYAGNKYTSEFGDVSAGTVEGSCLGYGISGGKGYIWVCLPFVDTDAKKNAVSWWGNIDATVDYCKKAVKSVCAEYGGDSKSIIIAGFSRGALACNYIGLHDDEISGIWKAFIAYSHYDGVREWDYPVSDRASALKRLSRLNGRPVFICNEVSVDNTRSYIEQSGVKGDFTFMVVPFRNHNDAWTLRNIPERDKLRGWLKAVIDKRK